jgi:hypothetical protein
VTITSSGLFVADSRLLKYALLVVEPLTARLVRAPEWIADGLTGISM